MIISLALSAFATIAGGQSVAPAPPSEIRLSDSSVSVPMRTAGDRPIVDVMINGAGPFHLGVETGMATLYLFDSAAARVQLRAADSRSPAVRIADSVRIGGLDLRGVQVVLAGPSILPGLLDGQLGLAVYEKLLITVDFPRQTLGFSRDTLPRPNGVEVFPLRRQGPIYSLPARIGRANVDLLLDTQGGSTISLWSDVFPRVNVTQPPVTVGMVRGPAFGTIPRQVARLRDTVVLGRFQLLAPLVEVNPKRLPIADGIIGIHTLKDFAVSLDQRTMRVRLTRSSSTVPAPAALRGRGIAVIYGTGPLGVLAVVPHLPGAAAGLATGDVILEADGRSTRGFGPADWEPLETKPDTLDLLIDHHGTTRHVRVASALLVS